MEEEYEGEEQLATVTVVQDFDLVPPPERERVPKAEKVEGKREEVEHRKLKKKVKYESKAARRVEQRKQRARRTEKAQRARR